MKILPCLGNNHGSGKNGRISDRIVTFQTQPVSTEHWLWEEGWEKNGTTRNNSPCKFHAFPSNKKRQSSNRDLLKSKCKRFCSLPLRAFINEVVDSTKRWCANSESPFVDTSTNPLNILEGGTLPETVTQREDRESQETFSCHPFWDGATPNQYSSPGRHIVSYRYQTSRHSQRSTPRWVRNILPSQNALWIQSHCPLMSVKKGEILHVPHPHTFQEHLQHPWLMEAPVLPSIERASSCSNAAGLHTPKDIHKSASHRKDNTL